MPYEEMFLMRMPVGIHIYVDGNYAGGCAATESRRDMSEKYASKKILEEYGFNLDVEVNEPGEKTISVYAIDSAREKNLLLKEFTIDVPDR